MPPCSSREAGERGLRNHVLHRPHRSIRCWRAFRRPAGQPPNVSPAWKRWVTHPHKIKVFRSALGAAPNHASCILPFIMISYTVTIERTRHHKPQSKMLPHQPNQSRPSPELISAPTFQLASNSPCPLCLCGERTCLRGSPSTHLTAYPEINPNTKYINTLHIIVLPNPSRIINIHKPCEVFQRTLRQPIPHKTNALSNSSPNSQFFKVLVSAPHSNEKAHLASPPLIKSPLPHSLDPRMPHTNEVEIGSFRIGGPNPLFLIAGPCVIETESHAMSMAERISEIAAALKIPYVFKASYDKANRTSIYSYRGPGISEGLRILGKIKDNYSLPILTDVHDVHADRAKPPQSATCCKFPHSFRGKLISSRSSSLRTRRELEKGPISLAVGNDQRR